MRGRESRKKCGGWGAGKSVGDGEQEKVWGMESRKKCGGWRAGKSVGGGEQEKVWGMGSKREGPVFLLTHFFLFSCIPTGQPAVYNVCVPPSVSP